LRFEVKTSRGYIIVEDLDKDRVAIWFAEGHEVAIAREKGKLQLLGWVERTSLRRLGKAV